MIVITEAAFPSDRDTVRALFNAYAAELDFDLCFQDFDAELATLPGAYAAPAGCVLVARDGAVPAGCVALRPWKADACEMKRLYLCPAYRNRGLGRRLAEAILAAAIARGYRRMLLDTVPQMAAAIALYRSLGFHETSPYRENPIPGALYFERIFATDPKSGP